MATTTKSTRKKPARTAQASRATKTTTKKTTAKTSTRSANARTRSAAKTKTVVKKDSAKSTAKASVRSSSQSRSPLDRLRGLHLSKTFLYAVFAGLVIGFVETAERPVSLALQTRDQFAGGENVILGPAYEVLYNIEPEYVLVTALLLSALGSLLLATKLRNRYAATIANRTSGFRWVMLGISSALLLTFVNMLAGVHDLAALKLSGAMILVTTVLAWLAERDSAGGQPRWLAFVASLFTGAIAWLPLAGSLIGTTVYGMERFGWHVYALAGVVLLGFTLFAINQYRDLKAAGTGRDYPAVEQTYLRTDMLIKFAVVLIVLLALQ